MSDLEPLLPGLTVPRHKIRPLCAAAPMPDRTVPNRPSQLPAAADTSGEADTAAAGCTATRHDASRAAYQSGCRCQGAIDANRQYHRDYNRRGREHDAWRQKQNTYARRYQERKRHDPRTHAQLLADRRRWAAAQRQRERDAMRTYVDPIAVERAIDGELVKLNGNERRAAYVQLRRRGYAPGAAGDVLRMNGRTVKRYETEMTEQEAAA